MRRKILLTVAILMLAAGIGLLLFPPISNFAGKQIAEAETEKFDLQIKNAVDGETYEEAFENGEIDKEGCPVDSNGKRTSDIPLLFSADLDRLHRDSIEYNENLKENQRALLTDSSVYTKPALNLKDYGIYDGIYGYVSAPTINMKLPVYLGANGETMSYGAAHMTYTSLPLGGEKTNAVLAGHTGYVGRIFFDNLRSLKTGDEVTLTNYWETLTYKVADTHVYKPDESQAIYINDDRDLLTMFTCISDGNGGFNRCYVICERA